MYGIGARRRSTGDLGTAGVRWHRLGPVVPRSGRVRMHSYSNMSMIITAAISTELKTALCNRLHGVEFICVLQMSWCPADLRWCPRRCRRPTP